MLSSIVSVCCLDARSNCQGSGSACKRNLGLLDRSMAAAAPLAVPTTQASATEYFDVLNEIGAKTGIVKARNHVHRDGIHVHIQDEHSPAAFLHHRQPKCQASLAVQETGTGLCMFGCISKALGICSFRKELLAKSPGPTCGTFQPQGMVSTFTHIHLHHPATPGIQNILQLPLGISLSRQLSERHTRRLE